MLRSIRWRLVMGTMLLTLLTVGAVGVVALLLMQRYVVQQERAYLTANAESIARQAATFMSPIQAAPPLQQLAQTAAFLGDVTVRIVDDEQRPLADSSLTAPNSATAQLADAPLYFRIATPDALGVDQPSSQLMLHTREVMLETSVDISRTTSPVAANIIVVQKSPGFWGDRLIFENEDTSMLAVASPSTALSPSIPSVTADYVTDYVTDYATKSTRGQLMTATARGAVTAPMVAPAVPFFRVFDEEAHVAAMAGGVGVWQMDVSPLWEPSIASRDEGEPPSFWQLIGLQALDVVAAPIRMDGATIGFVELGRATDLVNEPLGAIRQALAIAAGASSLLALTVGLVMSRTLTAPIQHLAQTAAAMSGGDLTARAPVVGRDELAALARQFNQMADALHRSFVELAAERDTLRRFVADASHELRTPITALRTFNELLQGPAQKDVDAQTEFLAESEAQIARLEWITRNLLDLSRWDGGMATLALVKVEMGELVAATVTPFRAMAQERQIELVMSLPEAAVMATVDEQRLALAVGNLLDNALKFTPSGGRVEVGVRQEGDHVAIWVEDTGVGIDEDDLPHIFERFYRSPRTPQPGSGLGLAIVERIVNAHGATIQVESCAGAGSRFRLCLEV